MAESQPTPEIVSRQQAILRGLTYYFTGTPCQRGHISRRYIKARKCIECGIENSKKWIADNHEKYLTRRRKWEKDNQEVRRITDRLWRENNRDKVNAACRRWRERNREFDRCRAAKWRRENPELAAEVARRWRSANPEKLAAKEAQRRARKRALPGAHSAADVKGIFISQQGRCAYCKTGLRKGNKHVDHIVPLARGGSNARSNLQLLCAACNLRKSDSDPIEYMQQQGLLL